MNKVSSLILIAALTVTGWGQSDNSEFRSTWVITWEHIHSSWSADENKALIREILDNHVAANMNAVLWQVRQSGTAYYNSSYEPWGSYAGYSDPGYDPLAYVIEEAHLRGIEVHAWFNVFHASSTHAGAPAAEHPEWVCIDRDAIPMSESRALSPGLSAVREYTRDVAMEIVSNYDIDGLHLDYIRWNEYTNGLRSRLSQIEQESQLDGMISDDQISALETNRSGRYLYDVNHPYSGGVPAGYSSWEDWWRSSVTTFVEMLHDSIQAVKPHVRLSVAALGKYNWSGWQGYGSVYQDAAKWFNEGSVEQLTPMHYHWTSSLGFLGMLVNDCPSCWSDYIQPGIQDQQIFSVGPGSYRFDDNNAWNNHPSVINACRTIPWVDGFQFFSYGSWEYHDYWNTAGETFFARKTKNPENIAANSVEPAPPTLSLTRNDSLTYTIEVVPSDSAENNWFIIYRSEDDSLEPASDDIIDISFGESTYQFVDHFTGIQDYNGEYVYFATQSNRYWNESVPSNMVTSDSIPSFAPVILSNYPEEDDTVQVNISVEIDFSKTMNVDNAIDAFSIVPDMGFSLVWSLDHKQVDMNLYYNLDYATEYTVTIAPTLTDINGKAIDGNGDGMPGDEFSLNFVTEDMDIHGPVVFQSNLLLDGSTNNLEIGDVVNIVFDEVISMSSVSLSSFQISTNGQPIDLDYIFTESNEKSVLTLIPDAGTFQPNTGYILSLDGSIEDDNGNAMDPVSISFSTEALQYEEIIIIDKFSSITGNWADPGYSGSTTGHLAGTSFELSSQYYLPGTIPRKSARLNYVWDTGASAHLIREYLSGGPPREVEFDTSYTLQCYIYGDGSHNYFRFALDENLPATAGDYHEVSEWIEIDWVGWKLISWDLGSGPVGSWLGNEILEGTLRTDSFQITYDPISGTPSGVLYFDNYRIIRKTSNLHTDPDITQVPGSLRLKQNFPNPFNPVTSIHYETAVDGELALIVYDILGRAVKTLYYGFIPAGSYTVIWDGKHDNGNQVSSGIYICRLSDGRSSQQIRMLLLK